MKTHLFNNMFCNMIICLLPTIAFAKGEWVDLHLNCKEAVKKAEAIFERNVLDEKIRIQPAETFIREFKATLSTARSEKDPVEVIVAISPKELFLGKSHYDIQLNFKLETNDPRYGLLHRVNRIMSVNNLSGQRGAMAAPVFESTIKPDKWDRNGIAEWNNPEAKSNPHIVCSAFIINAHNPDLSESKIVFDAQMRKRWDGAFEDLSTVVPCKLARGESTHILTDVELLDYAQDALDPTKTRIFVRYLGGSSKHYTDSIFLGPDFEHGGVFASRNYLFVRRSAP